MNEKNESGPSVDDKDSKTRELRAKVDDVDTADAPEESDTSEKQEEGNDENGDPDNLGDRESLEDMIQNKEEALVDPPGLTPDVGNEQIEYMETDETDEAEKKDADQQEEPCPEDQKHSEEDPGSDLEHKSETELMERKEVMSEDMKPNDNISGVESGSQNPHGSNVLGAGSTAAQEDLSATNVTDELTDSMDLPYR